MSLTQSITQKLNDSPKARWSALIIVSITMMMGYYVTDLFSPLESILTKSTAEGGLGWSASDYGFFSGSYGLINVFLLMLFFGGLILDKLGIRFTGLLSASLMLVGVIIKYLAVSVHFGVSVFSVDVPSFHLHLPMSAVVDVPSLNFHLPMSAAVASLGFAIFGVGAEITGITISKTITKWFTGHELALAMGVQVGLARLGTAAALGLNPILAKSTGSLQTPVLFAMSLLIIGLLCFIAYNVMDRKLDASIVAVEGKKATEESSEDNFKFSDLGAIFSNPGFWIIALLCLLFYSAVFPFLKFATKLMIANYNVPEAFAGLIPGVLPFGTIVLTPIFGIVYDRIGKGATLMIIGAAMLTAVHFTFMTNVLPYGWFAVILMVILGIAFALVPSAMWPSVPKIIPMKLLGSAFAIIFYIQNIGLSLVPMWIGSKNQADPTYRSSMMIFTCFGVISVVLAVVLFILDKKKGYGLQAKPQKK